MSRALTTTNDLHFFGDLPKDVRNEVDLWLSAVRSIRPPWERAYRELAAKLGVSYQTAKRNVLAWRQAEPGKEWMAFINWSKVGGRATEVSEEFVQWYKAQVEKNQRASKPAYRAFCKAWQAGAIIPGLDNELPRHVLPAGCSYANLQKKLEALELRAMRVGKAAALAKHGPKVFSTRAGLWVGSHIMFDDVWHDHFVVYKGQLCRVLELGALDVLSASRFAYGTQPRLTRADGTQEGLKGPAMRMLLANVLFNHGYSPRGTELLAEHGTAAVSEKIEEMLFNRTSGVVKVRRSGITGEEQAVVGMFHGKGKGNPRFKSALESLHSLMHNELGALPGQTGRNRDERPESTAGILEHTEELIKAAAKLRPERAALLRLPLLEYFSQFLPVLQDVYRAIDTRTWHELEGWHACGHIAIEYRLSAEVDQWMSAGEFLALPATTQALVKDLARQDASYLRQRKLSPFEVFRGGSKDLVTIPPFMVSEILGDDLSKELACKDGYFTFKDEELHPELLRYEGRITTNNGRQEELPSDKYQVFVNPFDLEQMFIHDAKGRYMGMAKRETRVMRGDEVALNRQFGRVNERVADILHPVRARHTDITREAIERDAHNAAVLSGEPITIEEKERAAQIKANVRKVDADDMQAIFGGGETPALVQEETITKPMDDDDEDVLSILGGTEEEQNHE